MPAQPLTDAFLRALTGQCDGRAEFADSRCKGLVVRVTVGGEKTWSFRFRDKLSGKAQRLTLGQYPDLSLAAARARADEARRRVSEGGSPIRDRKAAKQVAEERESDAKAHAWETLAELYLAKHARPKKRSVGEDERMLKLHITPVWAGRDFRTIKRPDCIALIEGVAETRKLALANRLRPLLSKIFKFAIDRDMIDASPALALPKAAEDVARDRVLTDAEIRLLWDATAGDAPFSPTVALALRLILVTGARPGEVAGMQEGELTDLHDQAKAVWRIPASRMKGKRPHVVPLTPIAIEIINDARSITEAINSRRSEDPESGPSSSADWFIFASPRGMPGAKPIDANALARAMSRLLPWFAKRKSRYEGERAYHSWQARPPTPHDLRRTAATKMRSLGVSVSDVQAVLGHSRRDVLGIHYDWHDALPEKRRALTLWAGELVRILAEESGAQVIPLRPRQVTMT
ncbi:tyrosine-type recombinase/integrase [Methylobacterium durans]|uniref:Tyr recombinase domain-containing protein n=1 Tax=Methylobacterium durans TaxID=2202825 RepID=A0A2U8W0Q2_9HYPH|nr:site-specific integrase [Methylobacterium durans]AWN39649.1 hypothetical protein DK389_02765 [Methylobacterium durans]